MPLKRADFSLEGFLRAGRRALSRNQTKPYMKSFAVIATHDRRELLERTLDSLAQCRIPAGFVGTLVVENGGRAGTEEIVRRAPATLGARYLFEPVGNKSRALNLALRATDDGLIIFLDDDVRMPPTLLESYVQSAVVAGRGHFFGGPVAPDYEQAPPQWLVKFLPLSARGWTPDDPASVGRSHFFSASIGPPTVAT